LSPSARRSARIVATWDIYATQRLLGHADVSTTANICAQSTIDALVEIVPIRNNGLSR
jgi:site-specific recombinase XerC